MQVMAWQAMWNRSFNNVEQAILDSNIIDCYRQIYIFVDKNELDTYGDVKTAKAILLNHSMTKTNTLDRCDFRNSNNTILLLNMYGFDVIFENGIRDMNAAQFLLTNAHSSSTTNVWDLEPRAMRLGNSTYTQNAMNDDNIANFFEDVEYNNCLIPEPLYYSINHMDRITKDYHALNAYRSIYCYRGSDLVDKRTRIRVYDKAKWITMYKEKLSELNEYRDEVYQNNMDITELSDGLFTLSANSMISGLMYGYDSNDGFVKIAYDELLPVHVPFHQMQIKNKVESEIKMISNSLYDICKNIENVFGNIQVFISPGKCGDRTKMNFRDYLPNNQPVLIGSVNVDKDTSLSNNISETVYDITNAGEGEVYG